VARLLGRCTRADHGGGRARLRRCGSDGAKKELGLNPPCRSLSGYSPDDGDRENLDKGMCPCPSWKVAREEGDMLIGDETLPWLPKTSGQ
jgi:hypothetical protein